MGLRLKVDMLGTRHLFVLLEDGLVGGRTVGHPVDLSDWSGTL